MRLWMSGPASPYVVISVSVFASAVLSCGPSENPPPDVSGQCVSVQDCAGLQISECLKAVCTDGQCVAVPDPAKQDLACGSSDLCVATAGICDSGACTGTKQIICPQVRCMVASCDSSDGKCVYEPAADGVACEGDGNECTDDSCVSGRCETGTNRCPCDGVGDCPELVSLCDGTYVCENNRCVLDASTAVICPVSTGCEQFECVPQTGVCVRVVVADDTLCAESDVCSAGGVCRSGVCEKQPRCDDNNQCTDDVCNVETGACSYPIRAGTCDDGNMCTGPDICSGGRCEGEPVMCADVTACTQDDCDPQTGCVNVPVLAGTSCNEGDVCIVDKTCNEHGVCIGTKSKCDDENQCTSDTCNAVSGVCSHTFAVGPCDDENVCTTDEFCSDGVCAGGIEVAGCCNFDADCEDLDLCTRSLCSDSVCVQEGQPSDLCPDQPGCGPSCCVRPWCQAQSGECEVASTGFPLLMMAWNFVSGEVLRGFTWGEPAGRITKTGATVVAQAQQAVIRLPGRQVPAGTLIVFGELASGTCDVVTFNHSPQERACAAYGSGQMVAAAFDTAQIQDDQGRLDLSVIIDESVVVARMAVYLWHANGCVAEGVLMSDSSSASDLAVDASLDGVAVIFRQGASMKSALMGAGGQATVGQFEPADFALVPGRFSTALVGRVGGGRVAAWGGADNRIRVAALGSDGQTGASVLVPTTGGETEIQAWPSLAAGPEGRTILAYAYGSVADFDIGMVALRQSEQGWQFESEVQPVNESTIGLQTEPDVIFGESSGLLAWSHAIADGSGQYRVEAKTFGFDLVPMQSNVVIAFSSSALTDVRCIVSGQKFFCLWQKSDGSLSGAVLNNDTLGVAADFDIGGPADIRSQPLLLPSGNGAVVVSVAGSGATAKIVAQSVAVDGTVGPVVTVADPVLASAVSLTASTFGPFMYILAWTDVLGVTPGVRVKPFNPLCVAGFISSGTVCAGFGHDGYVGGVSQ